MNRYIPILTASLFFICQSVLAKPHHHFYDYGRVIKVTPVYHTYHAPKQRCYRQNHNHRGYKGHHSGYRHETSISAIVGAVAGGTIGNQLGKGNKNRAVYTAAGAVVGGVIGHEMADNRHGHHKTRRCYDKHQRYGHGTGGAKKLKGYNVRYRYKGETFSTFTHQHPGRRIKLEVHLSPVMYK